MPFDALCKSMSDAAFDPDKYEKTGDRKFHEFKESDYSRKAESAKVVSNRKSGPKSRLACTKDETRLGWMCGMERDRRVQCECNNYAEIVRNNCMFRRTVRKRMEHVAKALAGK